MKQSDKIVGVALVVIAALFFVDAWRLRDVATNDLIGPKSYPQVLAIVLAFLGVLLYLGGKNGADKHIERSGIIHRFLPMTLFSALYVFFLPLVGFIVSTTALLVTCFYLLGERKHWLNFVIGFGATVAIYFLFDTVLGVDLKPFPFFFG